MRIRRECRKAGWSLMEVMLAVAVLALLMTLAGTVYAPVKRMGRVAVCTSNLRQIGQAFKMYLSDYNGFFPPVPPIQLRHKYLDEAVLFCPEDTTVGLTAASSYSWRIWLPDGTLLWEWDGSEPNVVLTTCENHLRRKVKVTDDDEVLLGAPRYPFLLVLRAAGSVQKIPVSQRRRIVQTLPGGGVVTTNVYPGEPWYDGASQ